MGQVKLARFYDFVQLTPPQGLRIPEESKEKAKFIDAFMARNKHLLVTVKATHAARLTANNGFYFPDKMRKGSRSLLSRQRGGTEPYDKPVLVNHDRMRDPIGRVITADYIDTTQQVKTADSYRPLLRDLSSSPQMWRAVDLVESLVKTGMLYDEDWQGLGFIRSTGHITDADAIEKILDHRYMTISTSADSNKAICSVCHEDWVAEGEPCEHRPGKVYDDKKCFLMAGDLYYNEWSYVNMPADAEAVTEGMQLIDIPSDNGYKQVTVDKADQRPQYIGELFLSLQDSEDSPVTITKEQVLKKLTDAYQHADTTGLANLSDDALTKKVDSVLAVSDTVSKLVDGSIKLEDRGLDGADSVLEAAKLIEIHDSLHYRYDYQLGPDYHGESIPKSVFALHGKLMEIAEENGFRDELMNGKLDMITSDGNMMESEDSKKPTDVTMSDNQTETPELTFDSIDITSESLTDAQVDFLNDLLEAEIDTMIKDGVTCTAGACEVKLADAKLSSASRKSLPQASFCGPGRSFPVPDCAHVTAARRLIGRYNGPGNKDSILACVSRKAKAMGCDSSDSAQQTTEENANQNVAAATAAIFELSKEDQKCLYNILVEKLVKDGMIDADLTKKVERLEGEVKDSKAKTGELEEQLQWLRVELRDTVSDYTQVFDSLEVATAENHKLLATSTALIGLSKDPAVKFKDLESKQMGKQVTDLRTELQSMQDSVDFDSIVNKVVAKPNETSAPLIDPTLSDTSKQDAKTSDTIKSDKWTDKIVTRYKELLEKNGASTANDYLSNLVRTKIIPSNFDVKKYLNEIK